MHMKIMGHVYLISISLLFIALSGCQSSDSSSIDTDAIYARMEAIAHQNGVTNLEVRLTVGRFSNTVLDVDGGDRLTATAGGVTKDFRRDRNLLGDIIYETEFNIGNDQGTEFRISFDRAVKVDANNSVATLPAPFTIDMPGSGDTFNRDDTINLVWNPAGSSGDRIDVSASGTCGNFKYSVSVSDPIDANGSESYQAADFLPASLLPGVSCETQITLKRKGSGTLDPNFDGGYYRVEQRRSVTINIEP